MPRGTQDTEYENFPVNKFSLLLCAAWVESPHEILAHVPSPPVTEQRGQFGSSAATVAWGMERHNSTGRDPQGSLHPAAAVLEPTPGLPAGRKVAGSLSQ